MQLCTQNQWSYARAKREPAVAALHVVVVLHALAVVAEQLDALGQIRAVRRDRAAVAISAEVLAGIEAERADVADAADALALVFGAVGLTRIFDDLEAATLRDSISLVSAVGTWSQVSWDRWPRCPLEFRGFFRLSR